MLAYPSPEEGSITDGDDHEGLGGHDLLRRGKNGPSGAGWVDVLDGMAMENLLKRKRGNSHSGESAEDDGDRRRVMGRVEGSFGGEVRLQEDEEREEVRVCGSDWKLSAS